MKFSWRAELESLSIESDGIKAIIDFAGEGVAKAAVCDKCGRDVLSASERLRIALQDSSVVWRPVIAVDTKHTPPVMNIDVLATARLGKPDVDLDISGFPPPLGQVVEWFGERAVEGIEGDLNKSAPDRLTTRLVSRVEQTSDNRLRYIANELFADETVVVLGHLFSRVWR